MATLFTVPIASTGGSIVCTNPTAKPGQEKQNVYLLTFTSPKDNRLTPSFIDAMVLALDIIEHRCPKGVVVTTSGIAKFYSNGLDLDVATSTEGFLDQWLWRLFRRFLTYVPLETLRRKRMRKSDHTIDTPCQQCACSTATPLLAASCWPCTTTTECKTQRRASSASTSWNSASLSKLP